jgi:hypothetical protein
MNPSRLIYEDTPTFIPVPEDLRHRKIEVIFWPLDSEPAATSTATLRRRSPPPALAGKVREFGDVMSSVPASD